jgi:DNA-binding MarR family transcriptional regulator
MMHQRLGYSQDMTRWLNHREQRAWRGYLAMQAELSARMNRDLQSDSGLSLADFDVLVRLTDREEARLQFGELAEALQWEKSRLSHQVKRMKERGLVAKEECPNDARGAIVVLTDQGQAAIEKAAPTHVEKVRDMVFDRLDEQQVDTLAAITDSVLEHLGVPHPAGPDEGES